MINSLIDKIKSRGYWRVIIRPTQFNKQLIPSLADCRRLLDESKVSLRGWDYPHIDREGFTNGIDWIESSTDWRDILEFWRFYQSGQFANLFNCEEDWTDLSQSQFMRLSQTPLPGGVIDIIEVIYRVTEIYEFAARLAAKNLFGNDLIISVELHGMKNRTLINTDPLRGKLPRDYTCRIDNLPYSRTVSVELLLAESSDLALENILGFFERFNWHDVPVNIIKNVQLRLLERRH